MNPYAMENSIKMRKKEILNRGYSFMTFSGMDIPFVSKLPRLPSYLENPFFQNRNTHFGKSLTYGQGKILD